MQIQAAQLAEWKNAGNPELFTHLLEQALQKNLDAGKGKNLFPDDIWRGQDIDSEAVRYLKGRP